MFWFLFLPWLFFLRHPKSIGSRYLPLCLCKGNLTYRVNLFLILSPIQKLNILTSYKYILFVNVIYSEIFIPLALDLDIKAETHSGKLSWVCAFTAYNDHICYCCLYLFLFYSFNISRRSNTCAVNVVRRNCWFKLHQCQFC